MNFANFSNSFSTEDLRVTVSAFLLKLFAAELLTFLTSFNLAQGNTFSFADFFIFSRFFYLLSQLFHSHVTDIFKNIYFECNTLKLTF